MGMVKSIEGKEKLRVWSIKGRVQGVDYEGDG